MRLPNLALVAAPQAPQIQYVVHRPIVGACQGDASFGLRSGRRPIKAIFMFPMLMCPPAP